MIKYIKHTYWDYSMDFVDVDNFGYTVSLQMTLQLQPTKLDANYNDFLIIYFI